MLVPQPLKALPVVLLGLSLLIGCAPEPVRTNPEPPPAAVEETGEPQAATPQAQQSSRAWLDAELTDVSTGERFRLSDFKGRPVLLHAFAVW